MNELGIPYKFLLNGVLPEGYQLKDDEEYHEDTSFTPGMFRKFYDACKTLYSTNNIPDFIIRLNSSTFVDFKKLPDLLNALPKHKLLGGFPLEYDGDKSQFFVQGTAMIFSKDCIHNLLRNGTSDTRIIAVNDDVALTEIVSSYTSGFLNLSQFFIFFWDNTFDYERINVDSIFFRIKNQDRDIIDIRVWNDLYSLTHLK